MAKRVKKQEEEEDDEDETEEAGSGKEREGDDDRAEPRGRRRDDREEPRGREREDDREEPRGRGSVDDRAAARGRGRDDDREEPRGRGRNDDREEPRGRERDDDRAAAPGRGRDDDREEPRGRGRDDDRAGAPGRGRDDDRNEAPGPVSGDDVGTIFVGSANNKPEVLTLALANRHGLVTGATGTGKTVTLQVLAEGFSNAGVPVFAADIKGDLSGIAELGEAKDAFVTRAKSMGLTYQPDQFPVVFWDVFGEEGHPVRATISEMGPLLLSRLMDLNEVQEGVLNICFRVADEQGLLILDLKDLRSMLGYLADHAGELTVQYGNVSKPTIGTIQRALLVLENQGGAKFFSEPALALKDFMRTDRDGRGIVNILAADKLMSNPRLYATFLLWLLSELFEELPEVGDVDKPKLVFFFDEAHLLFTDAPKALLDKIEQVVRLIRSKGVGVYFVTQNPLDVPDKVLAQLGNRVQHALRAFTPRDQKAVRAAAETFRANPKLDTATVISELGKGEALVSFLEGNGTPSMVERCMVRPPTARVGTVTPEERKAIIAQSPIRGKYDQAVDSESAYEILQGRVQATGSTSAPPAGTGQPGTPGPGPEGGSGLGGGLGGVLGTIGGMLGGLFGTSRPRGEKLSTTQYVAREVTRSVVNRVAGKMAADIGKSVGGSIGGTIGRAIVRGSLGGILRR